MILEDEVFPLFKAGWDAGTPAINGGIIPPMRYDTVRDTSDPDPAAVYVEARVRLTDSQEVASLQADGASLFFRTGTLEIAIYVPLGLTTGEQLADVARRSLQGRTSENGVLIRHVSVTQAGADGPWFKWELTADLEYDEAVQEA